MKKGKNKTFVYKNEKIILRRNMRKNKKLLVGFLAVNSILNANTNNNINMVKSDKLFDKMVKNIESGKSNDENYKLIEKV